MRRGRGRGKGDWVEGGRRGGFGGFVSRRTILADAKYVRCSNAICGHVRKGMYM